MSEIADTDAVTEASSQNNEESNINNSIAENGEAAHSVEEAVDEESVKPQLEEKSDHSADAVQVIEPSDTSDETVKPVEESSASAEKSIEQSNKPESLEMSAKGDQQNDHVVVDTVDSDNSQQAQSEENPVEAEKNEVAEESAPPPEPTTATSLVRSEKSLDLKFEKLRDLMVNGSISNKEIHDNVLSLLVGGGDFDFDKNFVIESPESISQLLKTLDIASDELKAELWSFFVAVLKRSGRSLQACAEIGLIEMVLSRLPQSNVVIADLIVELLCILASYNVSERELKMLFAYLKVQRLASSTDSPGKQRASSWKQHATKLLKVFRAMPCRSGPDEFFSFPGSKGSGIVLPPISKFPLQSGWTFSCWVRLDPPTGLSFDDREKPYLFSFMTNKGLGYTAHFVGNVLVVTSIKVKGKGLQHCFSYQFQARRWYHLSLVFTYSRWTKNEIKLFVDGELHSATEMVWALNTGYADPFDKCMVGAHSDLQDGTYFAGQMTSVYLFVEPISPLQISALHKLGVSYSGQFRQESETAMGLNDVEKKCIYDGKLSHALLFIYTPVLCDGQLCLEASPRQVVSGQVQPNPHFVAIPHAMMRGAVKAVQTHSVFAALHSLGGIQCFYLLFNQLDVLHPQQEGVAPDYSVCHELLQIVCQLLRNSATIQSQMAQTRGFLIIANLLEKSSPKHLTHPLLQTLLQLAEFLANPVGSTSVSVPACHILLKHLFDYIFWNPQLWIHAEVSVQIALYTYMCETKLLENGILFNPVRRCSAIMQVLHSLKFYYWVKSPQDHGAGSQTRTAMNKNRPNETEIKQIRELMLYHVKALVSPHNRPRSQSVWSIGGSESNYKEQKGDADESHSGNQSKNHSTSSHGDDDVSDDEQTQQHSLSKQHVSKVGIVDDEFQAVINFLATVHEDENIVDVLRLVIALMAEQPATMIPTFDRRQGIRVVFKLLASQDSEIRLLSLKFLGYFLCRSVYQRKTDVMGPNNLFMLIVDRLLLHTDRVDLKTYNVLLELMTERIQADSLGDKHLHVEHNHSIENPMVFKVIASLIAQSKHSFTVTDVKKQFLADLHVLCRTSKYNRRVILQMSVWQEWLFALAYLTPKNKEEEEITKSVLELFRILLHHAVKYEFGGWRVWIDTMSILHSKISLYEWKQMAQSAYGNKSGDNAESEQDQGEVELPSTVEPTEDGKEINEEGNEGEHNESANSEQVHSVSPAPGAYKLAPFRIPEFRWSDLHKKLLNDLLTSFESDVTELLADAVSSNAFTDLAHKHGAAANPGRQEQSLFGVINSNDNQIFVVNMIHVISQLSDMIVSGCGGLLPVLAAATSASGSVESSEPEQGLTIDESVVLLRRLVALGDIFILGSNICLTDLENEKNMAQGATLRQLLRMVACHSVAVVLTGKRQQDGVNPDSSGSNRCLAVLSTAHLLHQPNPPLTYIDAKGHKQVDPIDNLLSLLSSTHSRGGEFLYDGSRLLQDIDVARLRAILYRDIEETKQAQFLAMSVIYLTSVLMVSRYRDILEPSAVSAASTPTAPKTQQNGDSASLSADTSHQNGKETTNDEEKAVNGKHVDGENGELDGGKTENDHEEGEKEKTKAEEEKTEQKQQDELTVDHPDNESGVETNASPSREKSPMPQQPTDHVTEGIAAINLDLSHASLQSNAAQAPSAPLIRIDLANISMERALTLGERLERALGPIAPLVKEIFFDFAQHLSKNLTGSHAQELVNPNGSTIRQAMSVIELVMLFCSQEWQNALQKHGGLSFLELINEGRLYSHAARDHTVRVANEAEFILNRMRAEDVQRHAEFESSSVQWVSERFDDEKLCDHLITSARLRDRAHAVRVVDKIFTVMTSKPGAWFDDASRMQFWKLDYWEDDSRRRQRFHRNPIGTTHSDAVLDPNDKDKTEAPTSLKSNEEARMELHKKLKNNLLMPGSQQANQTAEFTDEELLQATLTQEQDLLSIGDVDKTNTTNQIDGPVSLMTASKLVVPGVTINGTLSVTKTDVYFEMNAEDPENMKIDPAVLAYAEGVHGRWSFAEIRAIFSRRYLLQNVAIEVFLSNRTAVFFAFPDRATVKKVINALPRVGVGVKYGLPQTRRSSLATPRQLFKLSGMTARWQRREISNFDYLMFLNTIAGRSYSDLSQYPVFPWVISNYDTEDLDLNVPSNYRDLSKPIGALNPQRKQHFEERYASWEHDSVPPFHYGTHYSTAAFTMNWLLRLEPFTSAFIAMQGGHFDHPDRMFHSIPTAWKNCQRDTADVKEVIPEFYYLPEMFINCNALKLGQVENKSISDVELPPWAKTADDFVRISRMALESEFVSCQLHSWIDLIFGYKQRGPEAIRSTNVFYYLTYEGAVDVEAIKDPAVKEGTLNQIKSFGITPSQLLTDPHPTRSSAMHVMLERNKAMNWPVQIPMTAKSDLCMILKFATNSALCHVSANTIPSSPLPAAVTVLANKTFAINRWITPQQAVQAQQAQLNQIKGGQQPPSQSPPQPQNATPNLSDSQNSQGSAVSNGEQQQAQNQAVPSGQNLAATPSGNTQPDLVYLPLQMDPFVYGYINMNRRTLVDSFDERSHLETRHFVVTADNKFILTCAFWDKSFRVYLADQAKLTQVIYGHCDLVTCIARSECSLVQDCYIATGSRDCTVLLWHWSNRYQKVIGDAQIGAPVNSNYDKPSPKAVLTGHLSAVTCVAVCAELGLVFSGSKDGTVLIHTTLGDLLHSLDPPRPGLTPLHLAISRDGRLFVAYEKSIVVAFSINGRPLTAIDISDSIKALVTSRDGRFLFMGTDSGIVHIWQAETLTLLYTFPRCDSGVRSLAISHDQRFILSGMSNGSLVVFNLDLNKWNMEMGGRFA